MFVDGRVVVGETCPSGPFSQDIDLGDRELLFDASRNQDTTTGTVTTDVFAAFPPIGWEGEGEGRQSPEMPYALASVPINSDASANAHAIQGEQTGMAILLLDSILRDRVEACSCDHEAICPALNGFALLAAMESALGSPE